MLGLPIVLKLGIVFWKTILRVQYFDILMYVHGVSGVTAYILDHSLQKLKLAEDCFHKVTRIIEEISSSTPEKFWTFGFGSLCLRRCTIGSLKNCSGGKYVEGYSMPTTQKTDL